MDRPRPLWLLRMVEERFHRDDEDRPLREGRTPDEYRRPGEIEYRPCPYPGSRQQAGHPMNVSALRQTSAHWDEIVGALGFLRTAYAESRGSYGPDVMDLWRVSQLGSALPWYFVLRGEPLPAYAAALSKATLGTGILAQRLILKMMAERWLPPALTAQAMLGLAETTGTLVGEAEVCSAPDRMIARFLDVIVAGAPGAGLPAVDRLIAERDRVLGFGAAYCAFKLAVWLYYQARRFLYADICAARDAPEVRALLDGPCEPPDFYIVEPGNLAEVPPAMRAAWIGQLASLIVPFAPDGSDQAVLAVARRMAAAMQGDAAAPSLASQTAAAMQGVAAAPVASQTAAAMQGLAAVPSANANERQPGARTHPAADAVGAPVASAVGAAVASDPASPVVRAVATFSRLDGLFGELLACVESGLRGTQYTQPIEPEVRDRLVASPRQVFAQLR